MKDFAKAIQLAWVFWPDLIDSLTKSLDNRNKSSLSFEDIIA